MPQAQSKHTDTAVPCVMNDATLSPILPVIGDFSKVNDIALQNSKRFAAWLCSNKSILLAPECSPETALQPEHAAVASERARVFDSVVAKVRSLVLRTEYMSAFVIVQRDEHCPKVLQGYDNVAKEYSILLFGAPSLSHPPTGAKKVLGWDSLDFSLGSADLVNSDFPRDVSTVRVPFTDRTEQRQKEQQSSVIVTGPPNADELAHFLSTALDSLSEGPGLHTLKSVVKSAEPLNVQFVDRLLHCLKQRENGEEAEDAGSTFQSSVTAHTASQAAVPSKQIERNTAIQLPVNWTSRGWKLWLAVCERLFLPIFSGPAFSDMVALWCLDDSSQDCSEEIPISRDHRQRAYRCLTQYLLNYFDRRVSSYLAHAGNAHEGNAKHCATMRGLLTDPVITLVKAKLQHRRRLLLGVLACEDSLLAATRVRHVDSTTCQHLHSACLSNKTSTFSVSAMTLIEKARKLVGISTHDVSDAEIGRTVSPSVALQTLPMKHFFIKEVETSFLKYVTARLRSTSSGPTLANGNEAPTLSLSELDNMSKTIAMYEEAMLHLSTKANASGAQWFPVRSVSQTTGVLKLISAHFASCILRKVYPTLEFFTLVPPLSVCKSLLLISGAWSPEMRLCVQYLEELLQNEYHHRKWAFADVDETLSALATDKELSKKVRDGADEWENAAQLHSREQQANLNGWCDELSLLIQDLRTLADDEGHNRERKQLRKRIRKLEKTKLFNLLLPFRTVSQKMAWFLPAEVTVLFSCGIDVFSFVSGVDIRQSCCQGGRTCKFHRKDVTLPSSIHPVRPPIYLHLLDATWHPPSVTLDEVLNKGIEKFYWQPSDKGVSVLNEVAHVSSCRQSTFVEGASAAQVPGPLQKSGVYQTEDAVDKARQLYKSFMRPHALTEDDTGCACERENMSYCLPPLHSHLSPQGWTELYSIRSHRETQISRLILALRGECLRAAELLETDFIVQHYLVTLLSDARSYTVGDAQSAMEQAPQLEEDIAQCAANTAPLLLIFSALFSMSRDGPRRMRVISACVSRALALTQGIYSRCKHSSFSEASEDMQASLKDWCSMYRVAAIGLGCLGSFRLEDVHHCPMAYTIATDAVSLALLLGLATSKSDNTRVGTYDELVGFGQVALHFLLKAATATQRDQILTEALRSAFPSLVSPSFTAPTQHGCEDSGQGHFQWKTGTSQSLVFESTLPQSEQRCTLDLVSGFVYVDGKSIGGLPMSILQCDNFRLLFGSHVRPFVRPLSLRGWYETLPDSSLTETTQGRKEDSRSAPTSFVFSEGGDVGLAFHGLRYDLVVLVASTPVHAKVNECSHYHFAGCFLNKTNGSSVDVVLFKPIPHGKNAAKHWLHCQEGRDVVDYVAVRHACQGTLDANSGVDFALHEVPYSLKCCSITEDMHSSVPQWPLVVTSPSCLKELSGLFPSSLVTRSELLVTVPAAASPPSVAAAVPLTVSVSRLGFRFTLTPVTMQTDDGYRLGSLSALVSWFRTPPLESTTSTTPVQPFFLLVQERKYPTNSKLPDEVVVWPWKTDVGETGVTEVWRHPHFRYLETHNVAERLRLCSLLLQFYPLSFALSSDLRDGRLCVIEEVCMLLARSISNRAWNARETEAFEQLRLTVMQLGDAEGSSVLYLWVHLLHECRNELCAFEDSLRNEFLSAENHEEKSTHSPRRITQSEAQLGARERLQHAMQLTQGLLTRRLIPWRCVLPPELARETFLETDYSVLPNSRLQFCLPADTQRRIEAQLNTASVLLHSLCEARLEWMKAVRAGADLQLLLPAVSTKLSIAEESRESLFQCVLQFPQALIAADNATNCTLPESGTMRSLRDLLQQTRSQCGSHPVSALSAQEVGRLALLGTEEWVRETAPWDGVTDKAALAAELLLPGYSSFPPGGHVMEAGAAALLDRSSRLFVELCVFRDWLLRMRAYFSEQKLFSSEVFLKDLGSPREQIRCCPAWLVFEAENGLVIRAVQYKTWELMWNRVCNASSSPASPGLITQLNMGEGKTRVVIPMLLLCELYGAPSPAARKAVRTRTPDSVPCVHALSSVAEELRRHLLETLGTPSLRVCILHKPFCRGTVMSRDAVHALLSSFHRFPRGVLVEQREYYVSFIQKRAEILLREETSRSSATAKDVSPTRGSAKEEYVPPTPDQLLGRDALHIFDEADELLSCRYNLVYSVGSEVNLHEREMRCAVAERLLYCCAQVLRTHPNDFEFADAMEASRLAKLNEVMEYPVAYAKSSIDFPTFLDQVLQLFLEDPPEVFRWMSKMPTAVRQLVKAPTDLSDTSFLAIGKPEPAMIAQTMCLRGYFQHNIMRLVLGHRLNVTFGIPPVSRASLMAVPYIAADVPSERSEFAQPDVAISLTYMTYFQEGLTLRQFTQAINLLSQLPDSQRDAEYERWVSSTNMPDAAGDPATEMDGALNETLFHIDLATNTQLTPVIPSLASMADFDDDRVVRMMFDELRRRMPVVAFWVFHFVVEREGRFHTHMLRATAWDIADQQRMVGFSGTKDACSLMPLSLRFEDHPAPEISGSTSRMSALILAHAEPVLRPLPAWVDFSRDDSGAGDEKMDGAAEGPGRTVHVGAVSGTQPNPTSLAQCLIWCALTVHNCGVVIDVGALMAGAPALQVARYACTLIEQAPRRRGLTGNLEPSDTAAERGNASTHKGVCFFDNSDGKGWTIMDVRTQRVMPLETSAIMPSECFVIYDQARCRGSDLKLHQDAKALVSLAQGVLRDALLQAIGRLRALGANQTVEFICTQSVLDEIGKTNVSTNAQPSLAEPMGDVHRVLQWVLNNTKQSRSHTVPEYIGAAAGYLKKLTGFQCSPGNVRTEGRVTSKAVKPDLCMEKVYAVETPTDCSSLYKEAYRLIPCEEFAAKALQRFLTGNNESKILAQQLVRNVHELTDGLLVATITSNTTTERELEQEAEKEKEMEQEVERRTLRPFAEPCVTEAGLLQDTMAATLWLEQVACLPFVKGGAFTVSFSGYFHKLVAGTFQSALSGANVDEDTPLRRIMYVLVNRQKAEFLFLTNNQASLLFRKYAPRLRVNCLWRSVVFLGIPGNDDAQKADLWNQFLTAHAPLCVTFARLFNGETYFNSSERVELSNLLRAMRAEYTSNTTVGAPRRETFTNAVCFFLKCRGALSRFPGSVLQEVCVNLAHEAILPYQERASVRAR